MKRRDFIKRLFGGAALAVAGFYAPGKPWGVAAPKPLSDFAAFIEAMHRNPVLADNLERAAVDRDGGFLFPKHISDEINRTFGLGDDGFIVGPRVSWGGFTVHSKPGPPSRPTVESADGVYAPLETAGPADLP